MFKYICKRVVSIFVTLLIVCSLTFVMMKIIPGGPFTGEKNLPDSVLESLNEKYHLNDPVLKQYTQYVEQVRCNSMNMSLEQAVEEAIEYCIQHNILKQFLSKQKAEVIKLSTFEYDVEREIELIRRDEREIGKEIGQKIGEEIGAEKERENTNKSII